MVEDVGAVGVIDQQFELLRAANVDGNRHGRVAAAEDRTGETLLAVDQHAEDARCRGRRRIVDADVGLESELAALTPCPSPKGRGESRCPHPRPLSQRERGDVVNQPGGAVDAEAFQVEPAAAAEQAAGYVAVGLIRPGQIEKRRLTVFGRLEVGEIHGPAAQRLQEDERRSRSRKRLAGGGDLQRVAVDEQLRGQQPAAVAEAGPRPLRMVLGGRLASQGGVEEDRRDAVGLDLDRARRRS